MEYAYERLILMAETDRGLAEIDAGQGVHHDEAKRRILRGLGSSGHLKQSRTSRRYVPMSPVTPLIMPTLSPKESSPPWSGSRTILVLDVLCLSLATSRSARSFTATTESFIV